MVFSHIYGYSLPTLPSFWHFAVARECQSEYQCERFGALLPHFTHRNISSPKFWAWKPFDFVRKLFTYERVARLSFPYPSIRLTTPHTPRPAPRAMTSVFSTSTAEVKKDIVVYLAFFSWEMNLEFRCDVSRRYGEMNKRGLCSI